jgi:RNA polymerase sigma-70 factor (ECF subfamily)
MEKKKSNFDQLIIEQQQGLLKFIRSKVKNEEQAEEILQLSLLKALTAIQQLEDEEKALSWIYRIIRNSISDYYRTKHSEVEFPENLDLEPISEDESNQLCKCIDAILDSIKSDYAEVIRRVDLNEEKPNEVAEELGISLENLKTRRFRARKKLKDHLILICKTCSVHACLDCGCKQ